MTNFIILATCFDTAAVIRIETHRQYVAKASRHIGSPFWDMPDNPIRHIPLRRSAGLSGSIQPMERSPRLIFGVPLLYGTADNLLDGRHKDLQILFQK